MVLSQAGIEGGRDKGVCCIQALTEQGEALGETQGHRGCYHCRLRVGGERQTTEEDAVGVQQRWEKDSCWELQGTPCVLSS